MLLLPQVLFWLLMAAVATVGWLAPWGPLAKEVIFSQAKADGRSPLALVSELYFVCLCLTSPLAGMMRILLETTLGR